MSKPIDEIRDELDRAQALLLAASGEFVGAVISMRQALSALYAAMLRNQQSVHRQIAEQYRPSDEELKRIDADMRQFQETEGRELTAADFEHSKIKKIGEIGVSLSPEEVEELKEKWAQQYEVPTSICPKCGAEQEDHDGFGVLYCDECEYCAHAAASGDTCDICGKVIE